MQLLRKIPFWVRVMENQMTTHQNSKNGNYYIKSYIGAYFCVVLLGSGLHRELLSVGVVMGTQKEIADVIRNSKAWSQ